MGANTFYTHSIGKTAKAAFIEAVRSARYDYGHAGYTGTIAEKNGFVIIPVPEDEDAEDYACRLIAKNDPRIDDKWGPAGCIDVGPSNNGEREFLFFGWASS
jgi:hypothetical protein